MFKIAAIFCIASAAVFFKTAFAGNDRPLHVLFIGNSYTSANSLPDIFQNIAGSTGFQRPVVGSVTPGGCTLLEHTKNPATTRLIDGGASDGARWDVVVLQEQSTYPAFAEQTPQVPDSFFKGAVDLSKRVRGKNPGAKVLLFETWARHPDLWAKSSQAVVGLGTSAADMQRRIRKWVDDAVRAAAREYIDVSIARVGDLWEINYESPGPLRLHAQDGSHPTFAGSYLAGLAIFAEVYGRNPLDVTYTGTLPTSDATTLKKLAADQRRRPIP